MFIITKKRVKNYDRKNLRDVQFFTDGNNPDEYFIMRHEYTKSIMAALVSPVTKNPLQSLLQHLILSKNPQ
mgnify:FL=1